MGQALSLSRKLYPIIIFRFIGIFKSDNYFTWMEI